MHLVADLVISLKLTIESKVHKFSRRIVLEAEPFAHLTCDGIAYQCLVAAVGKQRPFLGTRIAFAQQFLLDGKLDFIGLLGQTPRRIASSANADRVVFDDVVRLVDIPHRRVDVIVLARDVLLVFGNDIDVRQVGHTTKILPHYRDTHTEQKQQYT